jgi:hypothetical protein
MHHPTQLDRIEAMLVKISAQLIQLENTMTLTEQALVNLQTAVQAEEDVEASLVALVETVVAELNTLLRTNTVDATVAQAITAQVNALTAGTAAAKKAFIDLGVAEAGVLSISGISPATVPVNGPAVTIVVTGTGFVKDETEAFINGEAVKTIFVNATTLNVPLVAGFFTGVGVDKLTVGDPDVPATVSNEMDITVTA